MLRQQRRAEDRWIRPEVERQACGRPGRRDHRPSDAHVAEAENRQQNGRNRGHHRARRIDEGELPEGHVTPQQPGDGQGYGFD
jgi:hypothetical protein